MPKYPAMSRPNFKTMPRPPADVSLFGRLILLLAALVLNFQVLAQLVQNIIQMLIHGRIA